MEDTIQKGERKPDEETLSENERIVEEFLRQNQEPAEPTLPEDEGTSSNKVIQWVEQAGSEPASHASEVPELYPEVQANEGTMFVSKADVGEAADPIYHGTADEQAGLTEEPQASEEDTSVTENSIADQPVGLGDMVNGGDEPYIESPAEDQIPTIAEIPTPENASSATENQANEEIQADDQSPADNESTSTQDYPALEEPAFPPTSPESEEPALSPISPEDETITTTPETQVDETPTFTPETLTIEPAASFQVLGQAEPEPPTKKIALILSGGGAKGAFQVGAEKYARAVKGYHWDIIAGVSVGAMNGAMLSMHRYARLMEIWDHISDDQVYTGGFNLISLVKLALGSRSFYSNAPLQKLMAREFEAGKIIDDLHVGAVSLHTGEYVQFTRESLELAKAILASASIPVVWPPVDVSVERTAMVDGGVRNITPVGDVLDLEPDEIVIINCGPEQPPLAPGADANVVSIGLRALDLMQNEIFINDMKTFLRINALVKEAEEQGCFLHHPKTGRLLKYYPCQVIEPDAELGDTLDFSQKSIQAALRAGVRRAREVLGRP
jgi:NTE family protein